MKLNKYLNESISSSIEKELEKLHDKYISSIEKIANKTFKNKIEPFLKKRKYNLFVGNGTWLFTDKNNQDIYPKDKKFQEIEEIFIISIKGTRWALGEFFPNYK